MKKMAIIALDKKTTKFLTTAQVVTSVSMAVKELVENAFDAQANSIEVKLVDNGASLIEVSDDGRGIAKADTPFMGLQSYTSKIRDFCDLDTLRSYGFRGEALSSLCRVADVTVITKTEHDEAGRLYNMNQDGSIANFELCHRSVGTTIRAKSLFKDLPVRRQIITNLRRSNQDIKSLESLLRSFAICQPKIRISFTVNDKVILTKPRTETTRDSLQYLFGKKFISQIDFVEKKLPDVTMQLTILKKEATEFTEICQAGQYIFVNQRPVFYKEIEKVVNKRLIEHFGDKIPQRKKLPFLLNFEVSPSHLDVNLEPNKTSVLFTNQAKIIETLDKILITFYGIVTTSQTMQNISNDRTPAEIDTSSEYHDYTSNEIQIPSESSPMPSCKKRKMEVGRGKTVARDSMSDKDDNSNKENRCSNDSALNKFDEIPENISQLLVVDLGEDFSTQEISNLPNLDAGQVEAILGNTSKVNHTDSIVPVPTDLSGLTEEAWSKGQVPHLYGGTDVEIYKNFVDATKPNVEPGELETESSSTGCKGFLKFSREFRHKTENPGINFVETAKALTARWKELSSEERGYYRDLAADDKASVKLNDASFGTSKTAKRKITSENGENNRKRFLSMLENMKNPKIGSKKDNSGMRTIRPWAISMESVMQKCTGRSNGETKNQNIIVGGVNENVWLARIGFQIWALSVTQLFEGLALQNPDSIERTRDSIEELVGRWLREKDGMSLLHPVFDL